MSRSTHSTAAVRSVAGVLLHRMLQALLERHPVRQIGQRIVMRHVGDLRLGLAPLGDIDDRHQERAALAEADPAAVGQGFDLAAVGSRICRQLRRDW